jgi:ketosteroid isomerase-like protein
MSSASPREVVQRAYDAAATADLEAFAALLAEDVTLVEPPGACWGGTWQGKEAVMQALSGIFGTIGLRGLHVHKILEDGSDAVGLIDITLAGAGGEQLVMPVAEHWQVGADGLITAVQPYFHDVVAVNSHVAPATAQTA